MATLKSEIQVTIKGLLSLLGDLQEATAPVFLQRTLALADGVGANQARTIFADNRTLAPSTTEDLDLAGGTLVDPFGAAFAPTKVRAIIIVAAVGNVNNVVIGGDVNSLPFLSAAATTVTLKPGGIFVFVDPSLAGVAVTPGTGDIIQVANSGAGTSVDYSVVIIGTP